MIFTIYKRAFDVLKEQPWKLWGISWLCAFFISVSASLFLIPILALAVGLLFEVSFALICLAGYRRQEIDVLMVFDNFKSWPRAKRILCGMGWSYLWITLWGLIPVVGPIFAIIRSYEYRLVPYIMALEPEIAPKDALAESKKRTEGYRAQMFWSDVLGILIFLGLILVLSILGGLTMRIYVGYLFTLLIPILYFVFILFYPLFFGLTQAAWYEEIMGNNTTVKTCGKVCPTCGKTFNSATKFCDVCGSALVDQQ